MMFAVSTPRFTTTAVVGFGVPVMDILAAALVVGGSVQVTVVAPPTVMIDAAGEITGVGGMGVTVVAAVFSCPRASNDVAVMVYSSPPVSPVRDAASTPDATIKGCISVLSAGVQVSSIRVKSAAVGSVHVTAALVNPAVAARLVTAGTAASAVTAAAVLSADWFPVASTLLAVNMYVLPWVNPVMVAVSALLSMRSGCAGIPASGVHDNRMCEKSLSLGSVQVISALPLARAVPVRVTTVGAMVSSVAVAVAVLGVALPAVSTAPTVKVYVSGERPLMTAVSMSFSTRMGFGSVPPAGVQDTCICDKSSSLGSVHVRVTWANTAVAAGLSTAAGPVASAVTAAAILSADWLPETSTLFAVNMYVLPSVNPVTVAVPVSLSMRSGCAGASGVHDNRICEKSLSLGSVQVISALPFARAVPVRVTRAGAVASAVTATGGALGGVPFPAVSTLVTVNV